MLGGGEKFSADDVESDADARGNIDCINSGTDDADLAQWKNQRANEAL